MIRSRTHVAGKPPFGREDAAPRRMTRTRAVLSHWRGTAAAEHPPRRICGARSPDEDRRSGSAPRPCRAFVRGARARRSFPPRPPCRAPPRGLPPPPARAVGLASRSPRARVARAPALLAPGFGLAFPPRVPALRRAAACASDSYGCGFAASLTFASGVAGAPAPRRSRKVGRFRLGSCRAPRALSGRAPPHPCGGRPVIRSPPRLLRPSGRRALLFFLPRCGPPAGQPVPQRGKTGTPLSHL